MLCTGIFPALLLQSERLTYEINRLWRTIMRIALGRLINYLWSNLGNCFACMGTAFRASAAAWSMVLLSIVVNRSELLILTLVAALAITALWVAHLVVHAQKFVNRHEALTSNEAAAVMSRRAAFALFVQTFGAAALLSATPAHAQWACTGGTGACGQDNCPDCSRPCYVKGSTLNGCVRCRACGSNCGDNQC